MFKNKKQVRLDLKMESGYHRLVVDYFDVKDKMKVREVLYDYINTAFGDLLLQVDSGFINKKMEGKEGGWVEKLIQWSLEKEVPVERFTFKREVAGGVLGGLLGSKVPVPGYRVGALIGGKHVMEAVLFHREIDMGVHVGCGIKEEARETVLKEFCSGCIDEFNFSNYYSVDFYDYEMVGRCVMKCFSPEMLEKAKVDLEARFLCFRSN